MSLLAQCLTARLTIVAVFSHYPCGVAGTDRRDRASADAGRLLHHSDGRRLDCKEKSLDWLEERHRYRDAGVAPGL